MAKRADIVLERNGTRVIDDLDLAEGPDYEPTVRIRTSDPEIEVGGGDVPDGSADGEINVMDDAGTTKVAIDTFEQGGMVRLFGPSGDGGVSMSGINGDGEITVKNPDDTTTAKVRNLSHGARFFLQDDNEERHASMESGRYGGYISLADADGTPTVRLHGNDAALELMGRPESGPGDEEPRQQYGGGELVLKAWGDPGDTLVHVSGERDSDYGLGAGHRPRIYLDGPDATAELGRGEQAGVNDPVAGSVVLRDTFGNPLLRANAESRTHSRDDQHASELLFSHAVGEDHVPRGAIRSHEEGLMFYDSQDQPALLITTNGKIITRGPIDEGGL